MAIASVARSGAMGGFALWAPLPHHVSLNGTECVVTFSGNGMVLASPEGEVMVERRAGAWFIDGGAAPFDPVVVGDTVLVLGPGGVPALLDDPHETETGVLSWATRGAKPLARARPLNVRGFLLRQGGSRLTRWGKA